MAPVVTLDFNSETPISRTIQYKKVTKPLLERQRRARINRCLDELKDLMAGALAAEHGENMAKLEKADVLELTVRHLHKLRRERRLAANPVTASDRFRAGFTQCAREVSVALAATPGVDISLGTRLMTHLGHSLNNLDATIAAAAAASTTTTIISSTPARSYSPPESPVSITDAQELQLQQQSWRPESPLSSGYGSADDALMMQLERSSSKASNGSVWRPW